MTEDIDLRRDAMHAASSAGVDAPRVAEELYRFLTTPDGVVLPEPPKGMTYVLEPSNASHVEIGGQRMTAEQFEAARRPLIDQQLNRTLAVGDELSSAATIEATPLDTVVIDQDGDRYAHAIDPDWDESLETWRLLSDGEPTTHWSSRELEEYGPVTIESLPTAPATPTE